MKSWLAPTRPAFALRRPASLSLYDSAAGYVRPTTPDSAATLYVCGITPYDATHIGHAATYLAFDLVHRYWLAAGHEVRYVQNATDVDDPLLERANRDNVDWQALAESQIDLFRGDMTALRVLPPQHYIGVVQEMSTVADAVAELLAAGAGYRVPDEQNPDIYFDISATGRFGYESREDRTTMLALSAERGGDPHRPGKKDPLDPLLWRMSRPDEPSWPSQIGAGRAGWHIECAAIARKYLGPTIDVQGGGSDLTFPHHECSAAHAEVLSDVERFAGHYTHAGMLSYQGQKMSKSLGNLVFVSNLVADGVDPTTIRLALLAAHYRTDREWTDDVLTDAADRLQRWRAAAVGNGTGSAEAVIDKLGAALANDLDTPKGLAVLDRWASDPVGAPAVIAAVDALLGIDLG